MKRKIGLLICLGIWALCTYQIGEIDRIAYSWSLGSTLGVVGFIRLLEDAR